MFSDHAGKSIVSATAVSFPVRPAGGTRPRSTAVYNMGTEGKSCCRYRSMNAAAGAPMVMTR